jgi:DNA (cytosine-5)-methyltransferase 1
MDQLNMFDYLYDNFKIDKPIRLIELFAGYGSQSFALKYLGVPFEHHRICEWAVPSIQAYKDAHFTNDNRDYSKDLTKEEVINYLFNKGISMDYNQPMKIEQIKRLGEEQVRTIYNNICATNNLVNVQQVQGKDLDICDKDKYCYIMTYSFPCQDLSLAGLGKGMSRDGGTRSGMLWEVERILDECNELGTLPQVLLMENVPQVIGCNAISDFQEWRAKLESLGYSNYVEILNAKDYGIPQNRERCFMVSILGDYNYNFPKKIPLEKKLKDILENNVDEKYYLSDKQLEYVLDMQNTALNSGRDINDRIVNPNIAKTISCRGAVDQRADVTNFAIDECEEEIKVKDLKLRIKNATQKGYLDAYEGDGVDISSRIETHRGTVQKGISQTIKTSIDVGVVVKDEYVGTYNFSASDNFMQGKDRFHENREVSPTLLTQPKEGVVLLGGLGEKDSNGGTQWKQQNRIYSSEGTSISITTGFHPYYNQNLRIRKLTPKECFRLMGVKDEDYENIAKNQSNSKLYHLAGDSIVVNVLMGIFKQML